MKKIILCMLVVTYTFHAYNQQISQTPQLTKQDFLKKSKKQKTVAWILLGGGTVVAMTGLVIGLGDASESLYGILTFNPERLNNSDEGGVIALVGLAGMVGSIPLFVASGKNKRKATSLSFEMQQTPQMRISKITKQSIPSLSLKVGL